MIKTLKLFRKAKKLCILCILFLIVTQLDGFSRALHGAMPGIRQVVFGWALTVAAAVTGAASENEEDD